MIAALPFSTATLTSAKLLPTTALRRGLDSTSLTNGAFSNVCRTRVCRSAAESPIGQRELQRRKNPAHERTALRHESQLTADMAGLHRHPHFRDVLMRQNFVGAKIIRPRRMMRPCARRRPAPARTGHRARRDESDIEIAQRRAARSAKPSRNNPGWRCVSLPPARRDSTPAFRKRSVGRSGNQPTNRPAARARKDPPPANPSPTGREFSPARHAEARRKPLPVRSRKNRASRLRSRNFPGECRADSDALPKTPARLTNATLPRMLAALGCCESQRSSSPPP